MNIDKKPRYPFQLISALLAENRQKQHKKMRKPQFSLLYLVIFQVCIQGVTSYNLVYVQNPFYWLSYFEITLKQSLDNSDQSVYTGSESWRRSRIQYLPWRTFLSLRVAYAKHCTISRACSFYFSRGRWRGPYWQRGRQEWGRTR